MFNRQAPLTCRRKWMRASTASTKAGGAGPQLPLARTIGKLAAYLCGSFALSFADYFSAPHAWSSARYAEHTAPMPELVAMPPHPFSSSATLSSSARMVGLPIRV